MKNQVKIPVYNIDRIIKLKQKIINEILFQYFGLPLVDDDYKDLVKQILKVLPVGIDYDVLFQSMSNVVGLPINDKIAEELAWRLAGNVHNLKKGKIVNPWKTQLINEWVPVQVISVNPTVKFYKDKNKSVNKQAAYIRLKILAGSPSSLEMTKLWTNDYIRYLRTEFGFSNWNKLKIQGTFSKTNNYPFYDVTELFRLRFLVLIEPNLCRDGPSFEKLKCPSSYKTWNREIFKLRHRIDFQCPKNYIHQCYECPIGFDQCKAACHKNTYKWSKCPICQEENYCDPTNASGMCISCSATKI